MEQSGLTRLTLTDSDGSISASSNGSDQERPHARETKDRTTLPKANFGTAATCTRPTDMVSTEGFHQAARDDTEATADALRLSIHEINSGQIPGAYDIRPGSSGSGTSRMRVPPTRRLSNPDANEDVSHSVLSITEEDDNEGSDITGYSFANADSDRSGRSRDNATYADPRPPVDERHQEEEKPAYKIIFQKNAIIFFLLLLVVTAVLALVLTLVVGKPNSSSPPILSSTGLATLTSHETYTRSDIGTYCYTVLIAGTIYLYDFRGHLGA